ncbi:Flp family type IVb pilin [Rhodopirellula sp. ICT_H3.1]|uniref:Flp family type IVb pilin n=1 Tax=Aporhodopirellula aestuarii TaxID=2950107 RepID=A0ABT0UC72_9BACT|nr:Flp family type IVb pilin [Aporhodopirellula aestuarii]
MPQASACLRNVRLNRRSIRNWIADEEGTTAVEYAVMVAMIAVVCMVGVNLMTEAAEESFSSSAAAIGNA